MNYSDYGYEQKRPLMERLSFSTAPQMSVAAGSGVAAIDGSYVSYQSYTSQTSEYGAIATEEATYHRPIANIYAPMRSVLGDAYRFSANEALDSSNSWNTRAGYAASALVIAVPGLVNDAARDFWNFPNRIITGSRVMGQGWSAGDSYRFSEGLFQVSGGLLDAAGGASILKTGIAANQASGRSLANASARASYEKSTTADAQAAFRMNFVGPTIGRSGYLSTEELSDAVFGRYQQFTDAAYREVLDAEASGVLRIRPGVPRNTIIGQRTDRIAQNYLDTWMRAEKIPDGLVNINKYLRDPTGTGAYRIPDVRVTSAGQIYDGTIGFKWDTTPKIIDFSKFSGGNRITIVRPTAEGGSYSIPQ